MSSHEIVGIDVVARKLVAVGEAVALAAAYDNTAAARGALVAALRRKPTAGAGGTGRDWYLFS